jgi:hypothetical protein
MATAMLMAWRGVTREQYQQVLDRLDLDVNPPQGGIFHVAGSDSDTLRVLDLWESEDAWNWFLKTRLQPALQEMGLPGQPDIRLYPVRNIYTPGFNELRRIGSSSFAGAAA